MVVPLCSLTWKTSARAGVAVNPATPSSAANPTHPAHPESMVLARRGTTAVAAGGEQQSRFRFRVILHLLRLSGLRSNSHDSTPWAPPRSLRSRVVGQFPREGLARKLTHYP